MLAQHICFAACLDNYGVLVHDPSTGATASSRPEAAPVEKPPSRPPAGG